ncbi:MAG: 6-carboxytetrahydropterin synthase [Bacteroidales bacterium]|jgi:6-pyruvoyltetrahydropterin/6-carboxytetrahydropterin synthase|nr:6-carboxytetrahydropterin synthase [Bacteroidales bacterium]
MRKIRITKQFSFEMAHVLHGHDGLCSNVHGHSYQLYVCLRGEPLEDKNSPKCGMVMDFSDLKQIVNQHIINIFDHALVLSHLTDSQTVEILQKSFPKVVILDYQPTSEMMLYDFAQRIGAQLPQNVELYSLQLCETNTSTAQWFAEDNIVE